MEPHTLQPKHDPARSAAPAPGALLGLLLPAALALSACATSAPPPPAPVVAPAAPAPAPEIYRRADADRVQALEHEVQRLRADLRAAEETLLAVESGMRGAQRRAEALSMLAEARIQVDRAAKRAPWRPEIAAEAREKLAEADRQLAADHIGSAIFFVSRASRIAATLATEADVVSKTPGALEVRAARVNLRAEPSTTGEVLTVLPAEFPVFLESRQQDWALVRTVSGDVGYVRSDLLRAR